MHRIPIAPTAHGGTRLVRRGLALLAASALGLPGAGTAQTSDKAKLDSGIPAMRSQMKVGAVRSRGPYLEIDLAVEEWALQAYVEPTDECRALFVPDARVTYLDNGPLGEYKREDLSCQQFGVGNLELWRDRNRRATPAGVPRAQASFRVFQRDDERTLLRGQFPLASAVGFSGGLDLIAVVDDSEVCEGATQQGVASMEYRGKGKIALALVGRSGLCRILGLIQPLPESKRVEKPDAKADE